MRKLNPQVMLRSKVLLFFIIIFLAGCSSENATSSQMIQKSPSKLWEQNCIRCHNAPSPASFSDTEWEIIGAHMRVRAYLSAKEINEIVEFLKTIN